MHPDENVPPDELEDDLRALLASLDHPAPPVSAAAIAALAGARARAQARRRRTALRWAAAVLLTVGAAGAAVAAPGSPILRWAAALVTRIGAGRERTDAPPVPGGTRSDGLAGVAVPPGAGLAIVFTALPAGGVARVSFGERDAVVVQARAGAARFTSEPDRLLIAARAVPDTFVIEIPRTARHVELRAGRVHLLVAERGRVIPAMAADSLGRYQVILPRSSAR